MYSIVYYPDIYNLQSWKEPKTLIASNRPKRSVG